jgi:hypothetical protein
MFLWAAKNAKDAKSAKQLLSGIIFVKFATTAIRCGFIHVSTRLGLKFIKSLKHRHSGMFLAGTQRLKTLDSG